MPAINEYFARMIVRTAFASIGFLYHIIFLFVTPINSLVSLLFNFLLQTQLSVYMRATVFGQLGTRILSIGLTSLVDSMYLTELGVRFQSKIITVISLLSVILTIFNPFLALPIAIINGIVTTWVALREYRNQPTYCANKLKAVGLSILEGSFWLLALFIPFPLRTALIGWRDIARGVMGLRVIQRIRTIDFNRPGVLDISFLWRA